MKGLLLLVVAVVLAPAPLYAQSSWGVARTNQGDLVFCDTVRNRVWRLSAAGDRSMVLDDTHCHALVLNANGLVYGEFVHMNADIDTALVTRADVALGLWRLNARNQPEWIAAPAVRQEPYVWLLLDRDEQMHAWRGIYQGSQESQILKRQLTGLVSVVAGGAWGFRDGFRTQAQLGNVAAMAFTPSGELLMVDNGRVRRLGLTGDVRTEAQYVVIGETGGVPGRAGLWNHSVGMAASHDGAAVVIDYNRNRIVRVERSGQQSELWHSGGLMQKLTGGRWGWKPTGVALMGSTYYVMETWTLPVVIADLIGSPRILHVTPAGAAGGPRYDRVTAASSWTTRAIALMLVAIVASWLIGRRR